MKKTTKNGKIIPNGVSLQKHEYDTVLFLKSVNIVFDLRRMQTPNDRAVKTTQQLFKYSKSAKRLLIITKDRKLLDLTK